MQLDCIGISYLVKRSALKKMYSGKKRRIIKKLFQKTSAFEKGEGFILVFDKNTSAFVGLKFV